MGHGGNLIDYEIELVLRVNAQMPGSRAGASVRVGDMSNQIQALVEKAIVDQIGDKPELVSTEFRFRKKGAIVGGWHRADTSEGTKKSVILKLLDSDSGVTTKGIQDATGWKSSTVSAQLDYLSKTGFAIDRFREDGVLHYRLAR